MLGRGIRFIAVGTMLLAVAAASAAAQAGGPPGPSWKEVVPGRPVYLTPDSVTKLGRESFRYVVFRRLGDAESLETAEARCADHSRRTVRLVTRGKYVVPNRSGKHVQVQDSPNEAFEKPFPGGAADVILTRVCAMGRAGSHPTGAR